MMVIIGGTEESEEEMARALAAMEAMNPFNAHPFVIPHGDGTGATLMFAAEPWVAELYGWMRANAPTKHLVQVDGLLSGLSAAAIADPEGAIIGDRSKLVTLSNAKRNSACNVRTEEVPH